MWEMKHGDVASRHDGGTDLPTGKILGIPGPQNEDISVIFRS
jgi:hypothetical protein